MLYQRLQIPNQTETVRVQLQLALQALGQQANQSGGANTGAAGDTGASGPGPGPGPGPGGGHHHGHDGRGDGGPPGAAQPVPVTQGD